MTYKYQTYFLGGHFIGGAAITTVDHFGKTHYSAIPDTDSYAYTTLEEYNLGYSQLKNPIRPNAPSVLTPPTIVQPPKPGYVQLWLSVLDGEILSLPASNYASMYTKKRNGFLYSDSYAYADYDPSTATAHVEWEVFESFGNIGGVGIVRPPTTNILWLGPWHTLGINDIPGWYSSTWVKGEDLPATPYIPATDTTPAIPAHGAIIGLWHLENPDPSKGQYYIPKVGTDNNAISDQTRKVNSIVVIRESPTHFKLQIPWYAEFNPIWDGSYYYRFVELSGYPFQQPWITLYPNKCGQAGISWGVKSTIPTTVTPTTLTPTTSIPTTINPNLPTSSTSTPPPNSRTTFNPANKVITPFSTLTTSSTTTSTTTPTTTSTTTSTTVRPKLTTAQTKKSSVNCKGQPCNVLGY